MDMSVSLRQLVEKYLAASGGFGKIAPLASLGLSREETEQVFAFLDEDYHISRFIHFSNAAGASYRINGFPQTHVSIDADINATL